MTWLFLVGGSTNPEIDFGVRKLTNKMDGVDGEKVSYSLWGIVKPQEIKKGQKGRKLFWVQRKKAFGNSCTYFTLNTLLLRTTL